MPPLLAGQMSGMDTFAAAVAAAPVVPTATLATVEDYAEAQRLVDRLSDAGFPVTGVAIVGSDLRLVETVTGRLTVGRAALLGAGGGAWWGLFVGLLFALFTEPTDWSVALWGLAAGALFGAVFGALAHSVTGGRRDFASVQGLVARRFDITVPADALLRAQHLLDLAPAAPQADAGA